MNIGQATRTAQCSDRRTARVFGRTSQPSNTSAVREIMVSASAQCALKTMRNATASMAAFANVLPSTSVASRSWGRSSNCATILPRRGYRWASWATCHWLNENKAVSASAKEKTRAREQQDGQDRRLHAPSMPQMAP